MRLGSLAKTCISPITPILMAIESRFKVASDTQDILVASGPFR